MTVGDESTALVQRPPKCRRSTAAPSLGRGTVGQAAGPRWSPCGSSCAPLQSTTVSVVRNGGAIEQPRKWQRHGHRQRAVVLCEPTHRPRRRRAVSLDCPIDCHPGTLRHSLYYHMRRHDRPALAYDGPHLQARLAMPGHAVRALRIARRAPAVAAQKVAEADRRQRPPRPRRDLLLAPVQLRRLVPAQRVQRGSCPPRRILSRATAPTRANKAPGCGRARGEFTRAFEQREGADRAAGEIHLDARAVPASHLNQF
jgi:hypothetical protein